MESLENETLQKELHISTSIDNIEWLTKVVQKVPKCAIKLNTGK